jgi:hypothetical protein
MGAVCEAPQRELDPYKNGLQAFAPRSSIRPPKLGLQDFRYQLISGYHQGFQLTEACRRSRGNRLESLFQMKVRGAWSGAIAKNQRRRIYEERLAGFNQSADLPPEDFCPN